MQVRSLARLEMLRVSAGSLTSRHTNQEPGKFDDRCFVDDFPLSNASMRKRFGPDANYTIFDNKFFVNWAIFSAPR